MKSSWKISFFMQCIAVKSQQLNEIKIIRAILCQKYHSQRKICTEASIIR